MVRQHHQPDGHEFEQTSGSSEGQRSLACCSPWCCKESDKTVIEQQQQQQQMEFGVLFGVVSPEPHPVINSPISDCISLTYIFSNCQNIHIHLLIHEVTEFTVVRPTGSHQTYSADPHSIRGEGNGTPLQYSCLETPMDRGAWQAAVHGVAKSQKRLSDFTFTFHFYTLEKEMATYSNVFAWRIPGTGEPGGLPTLASHRVGHD